MDLATKPLLLGFADWLKRGAQVLCGFRHEQLYGTQAQKEAVDEELGFSARWFLQVLGTDFLRNQVRTDFHLIRMKRAIDQAAAEGYETVIIHDCRFPNEAESVRAWGGEVWRVKRFADPTPEELLMLHPSEHPLPAHLVDHVFENTGSLDDLEAAVVAKWLTLA